MAAFIPCKLCEEPHTAVYRCIDCDDDMCEIAMKFHAKAKTSRDHKVVPLNGESGEVSTNCEDLEWQRLLQLSICRNHNDEFKYYDQDCRQLICRDCFALNHNGHSCISIKEAATAFQALLDSKCFEIKHQTAEVVKGNDKIIQMRQKVDLQYHQLHANIGEIYDKLIRSITESRDRLFSQLDAMYQKKTNELGSQITELMEYNAIINQAIEDSEQSLGNLERRQRETATNSADLRQQKLLDYENISFILNYQILMTQLEATARPAVLEPAYKDSMVLVNCNADEVALLAERMRTLGDVIDGCGKADFSKVEGEGVKRCNYREFSKLPTPAEYANKFKVISYSDKDRINAFGGDCVSLTVDMSKWKALPFKSDDPQQVQVERETPLLSTVQYVGEGVYEIGYELREQSSDGTLPLIVSLNGKAVTAVNIPIIVPTPIVRENRGKFIAGQFVAISKEGVLATADKHIGWFKYDKPLVLNSMVSFEVSLGKRENWGAFYVYDFLPKEDCPSTSKNLVCWGPPYTSASTASVTASSSAALNSSYKRTAVISCKLCEKGAISWFLNSSPLAESNISNFSASNTYFLLGCMAEGSQIKLL